MRSLTSLWSLRTFIDVFNKFFPFGGLLMGSGILGSATGATSWPVEEAKRQMGRKRVRQRERGVEEIPEFSHTNPFGQEPRVNYSSFVFYLATSVWEWGSSKACQALIDAVWPEGFALFWRRVQRCAGSKGLIVWGIGVGTQRRYWLYCTKLNYTRWCSCFKPRWRFVFTLDTAAAAGLFTVNVYSKKCTT